MRTSWTANLANVDRSSHQRDGSFLIKRVTIVDPHSVPQAERDDVDVVRVSLVNGNGSEATEEEQPSRTVLSAKTGLNDINKHRSDLCESRRKPRCCPSVDEILPWQKSVYDYGENSRYARQPRSRPIIHPSRLNKTSRHKFHRS